MKIGVAQIESKRGHIAANIEKHKRCIELALTSKADALFFPELSLTAYEPELAKELASHQDDERLDIFQQLSDKNHLIIGLGLPTKAESHIRISMIVFEPNKPRQTYSKQHLHSDEFPFFEQGDEQLIIRTGKKNIAPAICYESLQPTHAENAFKLGAHVYVASVAKSASGVQKAFIHYPNIAKRFGMPVFMANSVGFCDTFLSVGNSAVWTKTGKLAGQLDEQSEGLLIFNTETEEIETNILIL